jgi:hypothetical protein
MFLMGPSNCSILGIYATPQKGSKCRKWKHPPSRGEWGGKVALTSPILVAEIRKPPDVA